MSTALAHNAEASRGWVAPEPKVWTVQMLLSYFTVQALFHMATEEMSSGKFLWNFPTILTSCIMTSCQTTIFSGCSNGVTKYEGAKVIVAVLILQWKMPFECLVKFRRPAKPTLPYFLSVKSKHWLYAIPSALFALIFLLFIRGVVLKPYFNCSFPTISILP